MPNKGGCSIWHRTTVFLFACFLFCHQSKLNIFFCFLFQTLELLYRITNGQNVIVIVQKMLDYLKESKEEYAIINLVGKIAELAEKYPFIFLKPWSQSSSKCSICTFQSTFHNVLKQEVLQLCFSFKHK